MWRNPVETTVASGTLVNGHVQLEAFTSIYHWNNIDGSAHHNLCVSYPHKNPQGLLLSRGNERFEISPLIKWQTCHCVFTPRQFLLLPTAFDWARTSNSSQLPMLLFIRGSLNRMFLKKNIFLFFSFPEKCMKSFINGKSVLVTLWALYLFLVKYFGMWIHIHRSSFQHWGWNLLMGFFTLVKVFPTEAKRQNVWRLCVREIR